VSHHLPTTIASWRRRADAKRGIVRDAAIEHPSGHPTDSAASIARDAGVGVGAPPRSGRRRDADGHPERRPAIIVGGSLLAGLVTAFALVAVPFAGERESTITGAILLGFAFGWALLAVLSVRFTDRPQRWAAVPAAAMTITAAGLIVLAPGAAAVTALGWVWPPLLLALAVWMTVHARRQPSSRLQPWLLYPVFGVLALAAVGGGYQTLRSATEHAAAPLAGQRLLDVGGRRLNIRCTGSGSPTVILEPGLGESASAMSRWIASDVARTTTVCVYDRVGHGRSDAAPANQVNAARDLHVLLERAHVPGPYVIAGHSLGGMFALSYAHRYPTQVGGIVLIDSMHPHQNNAFAGTDRLLALVPTLARTGLAALFFDPKEGNPTTQARQFVRDVAEMPAELNRAGKLASLGDRPLAVITAGKGSAAGWADQQDDLATLSSNSVHHTVAGATHQSLVDDRSDAAQSSRAVRDIVTAVRSGGR
jgi:pimeloyl-ACP methyl ester carboxylesterase